jgi:hypothetical protein
MVCLYRVPQMYLADGALPSYIDITTDQRLALAKKEKSKFFIGDQQVTLAKLRDAIRNIARRTGYSRKGG